MLAWLIDNYILVLIFFFFFLLRWKLPERVHVHNNSVLADSEMEWCVCARAQMPTDWWPARVCVCVLSVSEGLSRNIERPYAMAIFFSPLTFCNEIIMLSRFFFSSYVCTFATIYKLHNNGTFAPICAASYSSMKIGLKFSECLWNKQSWFLTGNREEIALWDVLENCREGPIT